MISALAGASATVIAMIALAPAASATVQDPLGTQTNPYKSGDGIPICHRNNDDKDPYVRNHPDFDSIVKNGHDSHDGDVWSAGMKDAHIKWGDIIPAFYYMDGSTIKHYDGKNWADGESIYTNKCVIPSNDGGGDESSDTSSDTSESTQVTVVKQWVVNGGPAVADGSGDGMAPGALTVDGVENADWNISFDWQGTAWPEVTEGAPSFDSEYYVCSVADDYDVDYSAPVSDGHKTITVTNHVTCKYPRWVYLYKIWQGATGTPSTTLKINGGTVEGSWVTSTWSSELESDPDSAPHASLMVLSGDSFTISETAVSGYSSSWECYLTPPAPSLRSPAVGAFATTIDYSKPIAKDSGTSGTIAGSDGDVTCYFTNTKDEGGGGGGTSTPTETPEETTTTTPEVSAEASEEPVNVIAPAPEVKGESNVEQVPAVAPSANAHTGQSQSGWAYGLLGAGILLLLTSVRVRRSRRL